MEAANALKKQMWAEVQLDKRRMKEEFVMKMQYSSFASNKAEPNIQVEGLQSPLPTVDDKNGLPSTKPVVQQEHIHDPQNDQNYPTHVASEQNPAMLEFSAGTDNTPLLQPGYAAERSRSQLKAYIGYRAEEMYVYRSLPLGQDRRRNRYWQFITSASRNDPGSGRIFVELRNGCWRLIDSEEVVSLFICISLFFFLNCCCYQLPFSFPHPPPKTQFSFYLVKPPAVKFLNKIPALSGLGNGAPKVFTWKALDVIVLDGADALCDCLLTLIVYQIFV